MQKPMKMDLNTGLIIGGLVMIVVGIVLKAEKANWPPTPAVISNMRAEHPDNEKTDNWTEQQFQDLAKPYFEFINDPQYRKLKYHLRYSPDLKARKHIFYEMYNDVVVWKWEYPFISEYRKSHMGRYETMKAGLIFSGLESIEHDLNMAMSDPKNTEFHERIKKLNPK